MADLGFVDYTGLLATVASWIARDDAPTLAAIPAAVQLCEARIARKLRNTTLRATITIGAESTQIPADVAELRSIRLSTPDAVRDIPMLIGTPEMLSEYRARTANSGARPRIACVIGDQLVVVPGPDFNYDADITYFQKLVPLSVANPTNPVLTEFPDVYLYGTLVAMEGFLEHDARVPMWLSGFDMALDEILVARNNREYGASLAPARLPTVF